MRYGMLSAGFGMMYPRNAGKAFNVAFNYTTTNEATGATATQTFSRTGGPFSSPTYAGDLLRGAWISNHNSFDLGAGYNRDTYGGSLNGYFKFGYGYIFRIGRLQVQPSMDFYWAIDDITNLGTIDNTGVDISLLGHTAHAQWTEEALDANDNSITYTYNASRLQIDYERSTLLAEPKLVAGTLLWRRLYIGIEGGWMVQLSQSSFFTLTQYGDQGSNQVGTPSASNHGSPAGPEVAFNVGYCFGGDYHRKKKH